MVKMLQCHHGCSKYFVQWETSNDGYWQGVQSSLFSNLRMIGFKYSIFFLAPELKSQRGSYDHLKLILCQSIFVKSSQIPRASKMKQASSLFCYRKPTWVFIDIANPNFTIYLEKWFFGWKIWWEALKNKIMPGIKESKMEGPIHCITSHLHQIIKFWKKKKGESMDLWSGLQCRCYILFCPDVSVDITSQSNVSHVTSKYRSTYKHDDTIRSP